MKLMILQEAVAAWRAGKEAISRGHRLKHNWSALPQRVEFLIRSQVNCVVVVPG